MPSSFEVAEAVEARLGEGFTVYEAVKTVAARFEISSAQVDRCLDEVAKAEWDSRGAAAEARGEAKGTVDETGRLV